MVVEERQQVADWAAEAETEGSDLELQAQNRKHELEMTRL